MSENDHVPSVSSSSDDDDLEQGGPFRPRSTVTRSSSYRQLYDESSMAYPPFTPSMDADSESEDEEDASFIEDTDKRAASRTQRRRQRNKSWLKLLSACVVNSQGGVDILSTLGMPELPYTNEEEDIATSMIQLATPSAPQCHEIELPDCDAPSPEYLETSFFVRTRTVSHSHQYLMLSLENVMMQRRKIRSPLRDRAFRSVCQFTSTRTSRLRHEVAVA